MRKIFASLIIILSAAMAAEAASFRVTQLRAAPGLFEAMIETAKAYKAQKNGNVVIMRHSQGNHWDLMLLEPSGVVPGQGIKAAHQADFQHSFTAVSDLSWNDVKTLSADAGLFHIEMFNAGAGKHMALLNQRKMENEYLKKIGIRPNGIWAVTYGSDIDFFTIGFYKDLAHYAKDDGFSAADKERFAKEAGFKDRADISFLLRKLIISHHDTLATQVK